MISIIIPTYNAESYLVRLLNTLKSQTIKNYELIIIDSSSTDKTVEIAKKYTKNIIIIPQEEFDHGGTRTKAAKTAKGDIFIFLTQDALPYDNYTIEKIVKVFKDKKIGAAYGRQIPYNETNLFGKHLRLYNYPEKSFVKKYEDKKVLGIKTTFLSNSFSAYRKSVLEEINWFKSDMIFGEDAYAAANILKNGYFIAYVSDARVYHSHSYTIFDDFKRYFDMGIFHKTEEWILKDFGKAEGEGKKYLISEFKFILKNNKYYLIPEFFLRNFMKYVGYKLGLNYRKLPRKLCQFFTLNKNWWNKNG